MNHTITDFYNLLFNPGEGVCWTEKPYGTRVWPVSYYPAYDRENFFCINPLHLQADAEYPDREGGRRADCNVTAFRNILLEIDSMHWADQQIYMDELGVPYSTQVYSGGKSMHFIISLEEPCKDIEEYRELVFRILQKVDKADKTTKNPSRLSRAPGAMRGNYAQSLLYVGERITKAKLDAWLGPAPVKASVVKSSTEPGLKPTFSIFTKYFLKYGAEPGSWNACLYKATCDMVRCGLTEPAISDMLIEITGRLDRADKKTIKSAIRVANRDLLVLSPNSANEHK